MRKAAAKRTPARPADSEQDDLTERAIGDIVLRPDGYHWLAPDGRQEFGPFDTRAEAVADRDETDDTPTPGETLEEAEDELGIASWIDPDTGELAEGLSTPRLDD